jgi:sulfite reductase (ferredoxin)
MCVQVYLIAETFDPYPYAVKLTSMLIAEKDSFSMPRKLKIAFDISEAQANYALINDLGFIPVKKTGERGFKVFLGGSVASNPTTGWLLFDFLPTKDLYRAGRSCQTVLQC